MVVYFVFICLKHLKIKLNCVQVFSPYRAVNTFHLGYKKRSVNAVYGNHRCLF
jgi:hypothetical protein